MHYNYHCGISLKQINRLRELDPDLAQLVAACVKVIFIYLSSAKNILHKARKRHNINRYRNTGRGDATAMPITALPLSRFSRFLTQMLDNLRMDL